MRRFLPFFIVVTTLALLSAAAETAPQAKFGDARGSIAENDVDSDQLAVTQFRRADKNGDGVLTEDEMPANLRAVWKQFDADRNGVIDLEEFKNFYRIVVGGSGSALGNPSSA